MLDQDSPALLEALRAALPFEVFTMGTGGGLSALVIDLSPEARGIDRAIWLTREERWIVGVYDFGADECDEGVCFDLLGVDADDPEAVASAVAGFLRRLGVVVA